MSGAQLVIASLIIPLAAAGSILITGRWPNLREGVTLVGAAALFAIVLAILVRSMGGEWPDTGAYEVLPGLDISFKVEPLGMLFALVGSSLWIVNSIYSIGYMRANNEPRQTPYYACFAIALLSVMGLAFASNLFTLFIFYEVLTLSTYPLVTHKADEKAIRGGRIYLLMLVGSSTILFLPAIIWTYVLTGTLEFSPGGILNGKADGLTVGLLLALYVFGIGKAAVMPMHFWLPAAMVAPTPVSALLHAVAVVKAGVFSVLKIITYIFGLDFLAASGQGLWLQYAAATTIIIASLIAFTKQNLKARLAYSTVSQLSYIVLGAALANSLGMIGGGMHIAMHAAGKITLFFCAGAIYVAAHKTEIGDLDGMGRAMPFTFAAFLIGTLSIIGLPPFGGLWSKWYLVLGALEAHQILLVGVLMVSSLFNIAYLLPIPIRAFFGKPAGDVPKGIREAPFMCLLAIGITTLACIVLFFYPDPILNLLRLVAIR